MIDFYKDSEKRFLHPTLFSERACQDAKKIYRSELKSHQFRNYFQELRALEARFQRDANENAWNMLLPQLHLLKAKLAYGMRKSGNLKPEFRNFMDDLLDSGMRSPKDFEAMMLYVEAVLAYFYAHEAGQGGC